MAYLPQKVTPNPQHGISPPKKVAPNPQHGFFPFQKNCQKAIDKKNMPCYMPYRKKNF